MKTEIQLHYNNPRTLAKLKIVFMEFKDTELQTSRADPVWEWLCVTGCQPV